MASQDVGACSTKDGKIDPTKSGKYSVSLGENILNRQSAQSKVYSSIRYNHKPSQTSRSRTTTIAPSRSGKEKYSLSIKDDDDDSDSYTYVGARRKRSPSQSYLLVFEPGNQSFTLEEVDWDYDFNLTSASWEKDTDVLAQQYPQLHTGDGTDSEGEGDFADVPDDASPEENNPYDFRHFLNKRRSSSPENQELQEPPKISIAHTSPPSNGAQETLKPKPKPRPRSRLSPSKVVKGPTKREQYASTADDESSPCSDVDDGGLTIEMDPKPSKSKHTISDGGLTIEMDPDTKPRRGLAGHFSGVSARLSSRGPMSLRSAASSVSPAASGRVSPIGAASSSSEESDFEETELPKPTLAADVDVEMLELPSPGFAQTPGEGGDDAEEADDDDLEAELAQALESQEREQAEGEPPLSAALQRRVIESESESEEE